VVDEPLAGTCGGIFATPSRWMLKPFPIGTSDLSRNAIRTLQLRCFMKLGGREDTNQNFWLHPQGFDMLIQSCIPETEGKEDKDLALQNQAKSCKIRNKTATQSNTK